MEPAAWDGLLAAVAKMPARLKGTSVAADPGPQLLFEDGAEVEQVVDPQQVKLKVYVVQPGLSKAQTPHGQLMLLAVTERLLSDTYAIPFSVICSP